VGVTEPSGQLELAGDERIQEYPPRGLTGYETLVEGHGVFCASASSIYTNSTTTYLPHFAFNKTQSDTPNWNQNTWNGGDNVYSDSTGLYTGSEEIGGIKGDWIKLKFPYQIKLQGYEIKNRGAWYKHVPDNWAILGSNDDNNWEAVDSVTSTASGTSLRTSRIAESSGETVQSRRLVVNSTKYYKYLALVTTKLRLGPSPASVDNVNFAELIFFGTPGPTTLDKGSLTLGRSLDVPRVSRYDVHTETPRPEKLILDYDTTINNSPLDISGSGNHGTFFGHAQYSAADKAFKFDGTGDTVYVDHNGNMGATTNFPTGDAIYTMSCWIKANSAQYSSDAAVFYFGSAWTSYQLAGIYHGINGRINMDIGGHNMRTATGIIQSNRWYHVAIVKRGTGTITSARSYGSIYIDGVEIDPANLTYNAGGTQALQSIDNISIGSNFNGSPGSFGEAFNGLVSKPQIWNVALENSEIRKIYNLGRTGRSMVISDTAVGIGRYPRSQLDVRGIVRATTFISESQPLFIARPTASILYTTDNTIISNWTTLVNRGGFLKSSGYVYAPSAGVYYFHVNMYNETNQIGIIDLHHNGVIACRGELGTGVTNNSIITLFATVRMEAGDYVYLKNIGDVELISSGSSVYNQFVGYKLS
jgi:hypothetical protein